MYICCSNKLENMYTPLLQTHWLLAVLVLLTVAVGILKFASGYFGKKSFGKLDNKLSLFGLIFAHLQLVVGLVLYFVSPLGLEAFKTGEAMSNATLRFYSVEHIAINIIAIVVITIGRAGIKRKDTDAAKFRHVLMYFTVGFLLLLTRVPWERLFELPGA